MTYTPHDALFKAVFSRPERAAEVLQGVLAPAVVEEIALDSLTLEPGSFVDEELREQFTDLLFSARTRGGHELRVYFLLEHQSTFDRWIALRLLDYMADIWKDFVRREPSAVYLPFIVPVVVHHGDGGWKARTCFEELFGSPAAETLLAYTPRFSFSVDDLTGQDEDALRRRAVSAQTRLTLLSLRSMRRLTDLRRWLEALRGLFDELLQEHDGEYAFALLLRYDFEVRQDDDHPTLGTFAAELSQERNMQTIAQMLENRGLQIGLEKGRQEGRREGRQEGRQEGLRTILTRQLQRRFGELPAPALARIAAADSSQLERWADRVLDATSLDDVLR